MVHERNPWFDDSPIPMYLGELENQTIVSANPALLAILERDAQQVEGSPITELYVSEDRDQVASRLDRLLRDAACEDRPFRLEVPAGRAPPVLLHDTVIQEDGGTRTYAVLRPLAEDSVFEIDRRIPLQKRQLFERLFTAIEQADETVVLTDVGASIIYVNPSFERTTGYSFQEALGQNPRILQSGKHDQAFYDKLWGTLLRGETWRGHIVNRRKNGELYEEEASITPVYDAKGTLTGYVAVKRDVTHEIELEKALQTSQRLASLSRLAGGLAHEFNNVLQIITGNLGFLIAGTPRETQSYQDLLVIQEAARRAATLTSQLLAFGHHTPLNRQPVDLNVVCTRMMPLIQSTVGRRIAVDFQPVSNPWPVCVDPKQVEQVLLNLVFNAADAIDDSGRITIAIENVLVDDENALTHQSVRPGAYVTMQVQDNGSGMDEEVMQHMFEPFFTTKPVGKGAGLGLAVAHGVVGQHGGHIRAESKVGEGSTFTVYWPATKRDPKAAPEEERFRTKSMWLLVVEPDDAVRRSTVMALRRSERYETFSTMSVATEEEATRWLRDVPREELYAVVSELLPGKDPARIFEQVLQHSPRSGLLAYLASWPTDSEKQRLEDLGVLVARKPLSPSQLVAHVEKARELAESRHRTHGQGDER